MKTKKSCQKVISFLDLLGTKSAAIKNPDEYAKQIMYYKASIESAIQHFSKEDRIWVYSDNAYILSSSADTLIDFYNDLRLSLNTQGIFFTAAISLGNMNPIEINDAWQNGAYFIGADATKVYAQQASLGGVGVRIDEKLIKNIEDDICVSYYYQSHECTNLNTFFDLKYQLTSTTLLDYTLIQFIKTRYENIKASRYYISAIISILKSFDYSDQSFMTNKQLKDIAELCSLSQFRKKHLDKSLISETSLFCLVLLQCIVEKTDQILHPIEKMQIILNEFGFKPIDILDLFSDTITRSVIEKKNWKRLMDEMLHLVFHNDKEEDSKEQMLDKY